MRWRSKPLAWQWLWLCPVMALALPAHAQQDDEDASALMLANLAPAPVAQSSNWRNLVEAAAGASTPRGGSSRDVQRLSVDIRYDGRVASGWRLMFSDRLDVNAPAQSLGNNGINTLKEAYLSWQAGDNLLFDFGRINVRNGLAQGYNPTDYFKAGSVRSIVSVDPQSMKENRQGSVMLRGQKLWRGGSLSAIYSPKIDSQPDHGAYSLDFGATNNVNRSLLIYSPSWSQTVSSQFLLFNQDHASPQIGFNLAGLLNDATVLNLEYSGGRGNSQFSQALAQQGIAHADDFGFYSRLVTGLTYTTANKMSFSFDVEYNGQGMNQSAWNNLRTTDVRRYGVYQNWVQSQQELPTQRAAFLYFNWQDAFMGHLDFSAMQRRDLTDNSRMIWLEARYHLLDHAEFALQWQRNQGEALSNYGVLPVKQNVLLVWRGYF
jgi:hypothetical protein